MQLQQFPNETAAEWYLRLTNAKTPADPKERDRHLDAWSEAADKACDEVPLSPQLAQA